MSNMQNNDFKGNYISEDDFLNYYFPQTNKEVVPPVIEDQEIFEEEVLVEEEVAEEIEEELEEHEDDIVAEKQNNNQEIIKIILEIEEKLNKLKNLVNNVSESTKSHVRQNDKIVKGRFNGEKMIGEDGKQYNVPVNYASKSKILEGEILTLAIKPDGTFLYKRITPLPRKTFVARLETGSDGRYYGVLNDKKWRLLKASVLYYKAERGDKIVLLVPQEYETEWAVVDGVIKS